MDDLIVGELTLPFDLDPSTWQGSFNGSECSLHQLAPYVGKLKTGMVESMLNDCTNRGDVVLDPFCGAGVVPLQALLWGRKAIANDLSPYACAVTAGKLAAPISEQDAMQQAEAVVAEASATVMNVDLQDVPDWVRQFYHEETLKETLAAFAACDSLDLPFIRACLLGILHHVRPGFLSYPASHLTPYLRTKVYPKTEFPEMYEYRALAPRLMAKVHRAYRRPPERTWTSDDYRILQENSMSLSVPDESVDAIVSSPPYFGALDYARDNRLRLWFLGVQDWHLLEKTLTANEKVYLPQMRVCLQEMYRVLKPGRKCMLVLGDVTRSGRTRETAEIIGAEAVEVTSGGFCIERIVSDEIPDDRRSRRLTATTKVERILVLQKPLQYAKAKRSRATAKPRVDVSANYSSDGRSL